ncbi:GGDEF domain-containing protein [Desulforamulus ruminis]|uniref:Diguanylate cyclase n=2 Tax=Desulforamulus ruminis TaxID=1564 RepID=F6DJX5_DESRL|nr:diguanylate cyclase [Desulforamulus ruminis DSM 2154]
MRKLKLSSPLRIFLVSFIAMAVTMATLGYSTYFVCYKLLEEDLGLRAQATAQVAAHLVSVDDHLIKEMMGLDIRSSQKHPAVLEFKRKMAPIIKENGIKYIYVETRLKGDEIRYFVSPDEERQFGEPPGTPLQYFYVLTSEDESQYRNRDRFDVEDPLRERAYKEKKPMYYKPMRSKWGQLLSGYAPLYDQEKRFVGFLGVDIAEDHFIGSVRYIRNIIFLSYGILVLVGGIFLYRASRLLSKPMYIDGLTGLYNHRYMQVRLEEEISRAIRYKRTLTLLMLDLDFFKSINDRYGHIAGDLVLKSLSAVIVENLREGDISCRYGGEELVVILPETDLKEGTPVAERLRKAIESTPFHLSPGCPPIQLTVSIGIAELMEGDTGQSLLQRADEALYLAKSHGRNRCNCC